MKILFNILCFFENQCVMNNRPDYWEKASAELAKRDRKMAVFVKRYEDVSLVSRGDAFMTLARSIVGQQISVRAAESVWQRLLKSIETVTPERILSCSHEQMRNCGLSARKTEYLADLARHFTDGLIHVQKWSHMKDEEIIAELTAVRGIGIWTAEMFLIFHEMRPDVFPLDDIGLQKAVALHYCKNKRPTRQTLSGIGEKWRPWRSVATWYLWRSLDPVPVEY